MAIQEISSGQSVPQKSNEPSPLSRIWNSVRHTSQRIYPRVEASLVHLMKGVNRATDVCLTKLGVTSDPARQRVAKALLWTSGLMALAAAVLLMIPATSKLALPVGLAGLLPLVLGSSVSSELAKKKIIQTLKTLEDPSNQPASDDSKADDDKALEKAQKYYELTELMKTSGHKYLSVDKTLMTSSMLLLKARNLLGDRKEYAELKQAIELQLRQELRGKCMGVLGKLKAILIERRSSLNDYNYDLNLGSLGEQERISKRKNQIYVEAVGNGNYRFCVFDRNGAQIFNEARGDLPEALANNLKAAFENKKMAGREKKALIENIIEHFKVYQDEELSDEQAVGLKMVLMNFFGPLLISMRNSSSSLIQKWRTGLIEDLENEKKREQNGILSMAEVVGHLEANPRYADTYTRKNISSILERILIKTRYVATDYADLLRLMCQQKLEKINISEALGAELKARGISDTSIEQINGLEIDEIARRAYHSLSEKEQKQLRENSLDCSNKVLKVQFAIEQYEQEYQKQGTQKTPQKDEDGLRNVAGVETNHPLLCAINPLTKNVVLKFG